MSARTCLIPLLLSLLASPAAADDETRWRESPYWLAGDAQPETDRKPLYRVRRRGAVQLRLRFARVQLEAGETLELYDGKLALVQRIVRSGEGFWSEVVEGEEAWLRLRHPGDGAEGSFTVDRIAVRTKRPAPASGSRSPSHHPPRIVELKLFRVHPNGDHDRLPPGARVRIARQGDDPDSLTFAVHGYDQRGELLSTRDFRPVVRYDGSTMQGLLAPAGMRSWRFRAGRFAATGLVVAIEVPQKPALSTRLLIDVLDDERSGRRLDRLVVARRRVDGRLEALSSGTVVQLAAQGEGQDSFDLAVTGVDARGRTLSPASLAGLVLAVDPPGAARVETKSLGEYRVHAGKQGVEAARLVLRLKTHEEFRLTLQIAGRASHTLAAAPTVRRAADQPYETPATSRIELEQRFRGRSSFELAGPAPAAILGVTLHLADRSTRPLFDGKLSFASDWRWGFARGAGPELVAVEVRWQARPGATLALFTARRPADGPDRETRRTPAEARWRAAGATDGRPAGGGAGRADWSVALELRRARRLRVVADLLLQLDRVVLVYEDGSEKRLPGEGRRLPAGGAAVFELPAGRALSRVVLHYRTTEEAAQPRIRLELQLDR